VAAAAAASGRKIDQRQQVKLWFHLSLRPPLQRKGRLARRGDQSATIQARPAAIHHGHRWLPPQGWPLQPIDTRTGSIGGARSAAIAANGNDSGRSARWPPLGGQLAGEREPTSWQVLAIGFGGGGRDCSSLFAPIPFVGRPASQPASRLAGQVCR